MLGASGLRPRKALGQNFLIDLNLMHKLLDLAAPLADKTVLEVGPGTGSLTEDLLDRAGHVVAVELDRDLHELLVRRLADRPNLTLIRGDVLADKHHVSPEVLAALAPEAELVANLPYQTATPLVADLLVESWRARAGRTDAVRFPALTFTVQCEVADRLAAGPGSKAYGPVSVLVALLGRTTPGPVLPPEAFYPRPAVTSRMLRIDFDAPAAGRLADADALDAVLRAAFGQRRKQLGGALRAADGPYTAEALSAARAATGVDPSLRAERVAPEAYRAMANALASGRT